MPRAPRTQTESGTQTKSRTAKRTTPAAPRPVNTKCAPGTAVQPYLPGLTHADKEVKGEKLKESALQKQIIRTLGLQGYACEEIGAARHKVECKACGNFDYPTGGVGNTVGTPDLAVFRYVPGFPPIAIRLEVKTPDGAVRPAQQMLADNGRSIIVRSVLDAVAAVLKVEEMLTGYSCHPAQIERLERFLSQNTGRI